MTLSSQELARRLELDREVHALTHVFRQVDPSMTDPPREVLPLDGVVVTLKDLIDVAGEAPTMGCRWWATRDPAKTSATVVTKLLASGANIIGYTNMDEMALGVTGTNPLFPRTVNPFDHSRIAGGSSSGSAAAVATGVCDVSIGTDTAGSVRVPAALCGVVGFKPTFGAVSRHGVMQLSWTLDHVGVLARSCADAARVLSTISGHDPMDPFSRRQPLVDQPRSAVGGLHVGVCLDGLFAEADEEVTAAVRRSAYLLAERGMELSDHDVDYEAPRGVISTEGGSLYHDLLMHNGGDLSPRVRGMLTSSLSQGPERYALAVRACLEMRALAETIFGSNDILISPCVPSIAPKFDDVDDDVSRTMTRYTAPMNILGLPVASIPVGLSRERMPLAVQVIGRPGMDYQVLMLGSLLEGERPLIPASTH